jgi:hypothetical protein
MSERERSSLAVQAAEVKLILIERRDQLEGLSARKRDRPPQEVLDNKAYRLLILEDICETVQRTADARAKLMQKKSTPAVDP